MEPQLFHMYVRATIYYLQVNILADFENRGFSGINFSILQLLVQ